MMKKHDYKFIKDILEKKNGNIKYDYNDVEKLAVFKTVNNETIVVTQSVSALEAIKSSFLKTITIYQILNSPSKNFC